MPPTKPQRRATVAKMRRELGDFDKHTQANMLRLLDAYDAKYVKPLREHLALPWWRRVFRKGPKT